MSLARELPGKTQNRKWKTMDYLEAGRERIRKNAFGNAVGIEIESVERDRAVCRLEIRPDHKNPLGALHGGVYFTLADNAAGAASRTDGRGYVTQHGDMHFIRSVSEGVVRAEARVVHRGRHTCLIEVSVVDEEGKLLATGTMTYFCVLQSLE